MYLSTKVGKFVKVSGFKPQGIRVGCQDFHFGRIRLLRFGLKEF